MKRLWDAEASVSRGSRGDGSRSLGGNADGITEGNLAAIGADAAEGETSWASSQACLDEAHDALNTECADALNGLSIE